MRFPIEQKSGPELLGWRPVHKTLQDFFDAVERLPEEARLQVEKLKGIPINIFIRRLVRESGVRGKETSFEALERVLTRAFNSDTLPQIMLLIAVEFVKAERKIAGGVISHRKYLNGYPQRLETQLKVIGKLASSLADYRKFVTRDPQKNSDISIGLNPLSSANNSLERRYEKSIAAAEFLHKTCLQQIERLEKEKTKTVFRRKKNQKLIFGTSLEIYAGMLNTTRALACVTNPKAFNNVIYEVVTELILLTRPSQDREVSREKAKKRLEKYALK